MRHVRAILFDLDGTLLDYDDAAWESTVDQVCADLTGTASDLDRGRLFAAYTRVCREHWQATEGSVVHAPSTGSVDGWSIWTELWRRALRECGRTDGETVRRGVQLYAVARRARYRLFADVTSTLTMLRGQVKLGVVTNGPGDTQRDKLSATDLTDQFDVVIASGEVGVAKPDPRIFTIALGRLGIEPEAAWHVGDSLANDVAGAANAGLGAAVWLDRFSLGRPDPGRQQFQRIATLGALPDLLRRWQSAHARMSAQ